MTVRAGCPATVDPRGDAKLRDDATNGFVPRLGTGRALEVRRFTEPVAPALLRRHRARRDVFDDDERSRDTARSPIVIGPRTFAPVPIDAPR